MDAEQGLLGSILLDNKLIVEVATIIDETDFDDTHRIIFSAMKQLHREEQAIDLITLRSKLGKQIDEIGGIRYLAELATNTPTSVNGIDYAKCVRNGSYVKQVKNYAQNLYEVAQSGNFEKTLEAITSTPTLIINKNKHKKTSELIQINLDDVARRYKSESDSRGMSTGYIDLDRLTDGIKGAEVIGLYAESNAGKSIMASDIARHVANKYGKVAIFAYEMLGEDITYRMLSDEMRISIDKFNRPKGKLAAQDIEQIKKYNANHLDNIEIFADELVQKTAEEIESKIIFIENLKLIIIDYLHLMSTNKKHSNEIDKYTYVLRDLKSIATRYRVPILLLMSQNKEGGFRGTQELKHDLDQLWELVRKGEDADKNTREKAFIYVKKGRNNKKGKAELLYLEDYLTFKSKER